MVSAPGPLTVRFPVAAVRCPVIVAVLMNISLSVVQESIFAPLQADGTIGAFKEVVTQVRVRVSLDTMLLWAGRHVEQNSGLCWKQSRQRHCCGKHVYRLDSCSATRYVACKMRLTIRQTVSIVSRLRTGRPGFDSR
jgi:hypothetical protein